MCVYYFSAGASTSTLVDDMRGDGLKLKTSILTGMTADPSKANEVNM